jgi:hypothetical protein
VKFVVRFSAGYDPTATAPSVVEVRLANEYIVAGDPDDLLQCAPYRF